MTYLSLCFLILWTGLMLPMPHLHCHDGPRVQTESKEPSWSSKYFVTAMRRVTNTSFWCHSLPNEHLQPLLRSTFLDLIIQYMSTDGHLICINMPRINLMVSIPFSNAIFHILVDRSHSYSSAQGLWNLTPPFLSSHTPWLTEDITMY